jgi:hypothetical protein
MASAGVRHQPAQSGLSIMKMASVLAEHELPVRLTVLLQRLHDHFVYLDEQIKALEKWLANWPTMIWVVVC